MNESNLDAALLWKQKAQSDWETVEILLASQRCPFDTVCFHCQQFAEKLLKGLLTLNGIETPRTHDLRRLIQMACQFTPNLEQLLDAADVLTAYGVDARYPGYSEQIGEVEMNEAVELAKKFGKMLLSKIQ